MTLEEQAANLSQEEVVALLGIRQGFFDLQEKYLQQSKRFAELEQQNDWFKRQLFGRKSERRIAIESHHQLSLGELVDVEETPPPPTETIKGYQRRQRRKQPLEGAVLEKGLRFDDSVPIEEVEIPNPALEGLDPSQYTIVSEKLTYRLAQRPGSYVIVKYIRKVVKLKEAKKLVCASAPSSVLEKSYADVSLLAGFLIDKFRYHLPLYRQHQRLAASGIQVSRALLTNLVHRTVDLLEPIYYAMFSSILQSHVITMDETPIKASRLNGKMKTGYFWPIYGDQDEIVFLFAPSRAGPVVRDTLESFEGILVSDGYKVYEKYAATIEEVTHAQCWAHTRRKFVDAKKVEPNLVATALDLIGTLYKYEADIREQDLQGEEKQGYREKYSKPLIETFFAWLNETFQKQTLLPTSPFTKAAHYALDREKALQVFLKDPGVPIDTNHIERQIRPVAIGRKNWMFCWTEIGARYAGIANSLIASCQLHQVDPYTYLVDVLQRIDRHPAMEVHRLTPRLWKKEFANDPLRSDIDPKKN